MSLANGILSVQENAGNQSLVVWKMPKVLREDTLIIDMVEWYVLVVYENILTSVVEEQTC